jgi:hypothetical protein
MISNVQISDARKRSITTAIADVQVITTTATIAIDIDGN